MNCNGKCLLGLKGINAACKSAKRIQLVKDDLLESYKKINDNGMKFFIFLFQR